MWGSVHNRDLFFKNLARYVRLLRFEKVSVKQLLIGIRLGFLFMFVSSGF
jgi:hypothetical protein